MKNSFQSLAKVVLVVVCFLFTENLYAQSYCNNGGPTNANDSEIIGVRLIGDNDTLSNFDNSCGALGIQTYLPDTGKIPVQLTQGSDYTLEVTVGTCGNSYSNTLAAWIDFDGNGVFSNAVFTSGRTTTSERLGQTMSTPTSIVEFKFNVPWNANIGNTRLRVVLEEGGSLNTISPCNSFTWGSIEDYTIQINNSQCDSIKNVRTHLIPGGFALAWDSDTSSQFYGIEYGQMGFAPGQGDTVLTYQDSTVITGLTNGQLYDIYLRAYCSNTIASRRVKITGVEPGCGEVAVPWTPTYSSSFIPVCWTSNLNTTSQYPYASFSSGTDGYIFLASYGSGNSDTTYLATPPIKNLNKWKKLTFDMKRHSSASSAVKIGVMNEWGDLSSYKEISSLTANSNSYGSHSVQLDSNNGVDGTHKRIVFAVYNKPNYYYQLRRISVTNQPCYSPSNLIVSDISSKAAEVEWNTSQNTNIYNVCWGQKGFSPDLSQSIQVVGDRLQISALMPSTEYDVYVMSNCSADSLGSSNWVKASFKTECDFLNSFPITEGFENTYSQYNSRWYYEYNYHGNQWVNDCWITYKSGNQNDYYPELYMYNSTSYAKSGSWSLRVQATNSSSWSYRYDTALIASPKIHDFEYGTTKISFYSRAHHSSSTYQGDFYLGIMDSLANPKSLRIVDTINNNGQTSYWKYEFSFDSVSTILPDECRIALVFKNNYPYSNYYYGHIDDISITQDSVPCPKPITLAATPEQNRIHATWVSNSQQFIAEIGPKGFEPGKGNGRLHVIQGNSFTFDSLFHTTEYDIYIATDCIAAGNGLSNWSNVLRVKTDCGPQPIPYEQHFKTMENNTALPECWTVLSSNSNSQPNIYQQTSGTVLSQDSSELRIHTYGSNDSIILRSPIIENLGSSIRKEIAVRARLHPSYNSGNLIIGSSNDGTIHSINYIDTIQIVSNSYLTYHADISELPSDSKYLIFLVESNGGYNSFYIDDIAIQNSCQPHDFVLTNSSLNSLSFSWNSAFPVFLNFIKRGDPLTSLSSQLVSDTSATLSNLSHSTEYLVWAESSCAMPVLDSARRVEKKAFGTTCSKNSLPFVKDFEQRVLTNPDTSNISYCWDFYTDVKVYQGYAYLDSISNNDKPLKLLIDIPANSSEIDTAMILTPIIENLSSGENEILINARSLSLSYSNKNQLIIGSLNDSQGLGSLYFIDTINLQSTNYTSYKAYLYDMPVDHDRLCLIVISDNSKYNGALIKSMGVFETTCPLPGKFTVTGSNFTNEIYSNATLDWDIGSNLDNYQIEIGPFGFTQGTGQFYTVQDSSLTISGLLSNTKYSAYIRTICSSNDSSQWVGPVTFRTTCGAMGIPLFEGFNRNNDTSQILPYCWSSYLFGAQNTGGIFVEKSQSSGNILTDSSSIHLFTANYAANIPGLTDSTLLLTPLIHDLGSDKYQLIINAAGSPNNSPYAIDELLIAQIPSNLDMMQIRTIDTLHLTTDYKKYIIDLKGLDSGYSHIAFIATSRQIGMYPFAFNQIRIDEVKFRINPIPPGVNIDENNCIQCNGLNIGDFFVLDEDTIEVVSRYRLLQIIAAQGDLTKVCVSHVTDMKNLFRGAKWFNQNISRWDVSNVTTMNSMFFNTEIFNQNISTWNVGKVENMKLMFFRSDAFDQDLNSWDVSNVTNMNRMFKEASSFTGKINNWDVENVTGMTEMFFDATDFDQDLSDWCVRAFQYNPPVNFALNSALVPAHYPRWGNCPQDFDNVTSLATGAFINSAGCVDCSALNIGDYFELGGDTLLVVDRAMLDSLVSLHDDLSKVCVSNITDMKDALRGLRWFNTDIAYWDVSNVTDMSNLFFKAQIFNQDIGNWDVSNVTKMVSMFQVAKVFNQDIGSWDVSNVQRFRSMFRNADAFDQNIGPWNVSNVLSQSQMENMFRSADNFGQDLSSWCVSSILNKPTGFNANSSLVSSQLPIWGTCPTPGSRIGNDQPVASDKANGDDAANLVEMQEITLFPNPTTGVVKISPVVDGSYKILDAMGKTLEQGTIKEYYNFGDQPNGVYMLMIQSGNNVQYLKVIKQ